MQSGGQKVAENNAMIQNNSQTMQAGNNKQAVRTGDDTKMTDIAGLAATAVVAAGIIAYEFIRRKKKNYGSNTK